MTLENMMLPIASNMRLHAIFKAIHPLVNHYHPITSSIPQVGTREIVHKT
jgi:hypothetical protein